jgi:hypothetical protein
MIVLHERGVQSGLLPEQPEIEALEEKTALVAENLRLENQNIRNGRPNYIHRTREM